MWDDTGDQLPMIYSQLLTMQQSVIKIYIPQVTRALLKRKDILVRLRDRLPNAQYSHGLHSVASGWVN